MQICCVNPTPADIPAIVDLDQRSLGGLWSAKTYLRELESPNSCLRILDKSCRDIEELRSEPSKGLMDARVTDATAMVPGSPETVALDAGGNSTGLMGVGCYWEIVDEAHITVLAIDPCYHRRGLGRWLLIHLLEDACRRDLQRATLEVRASNGRAISLYQSFGFEPLGTRKCYYPDGENALILWQNGLKTDAFRGMLGHRREQTLERMRKQGWYTADFEPFSQQTNP